MLKYRYPDSMKGSKKQHEKAFWEKSNLFYNWPRFSWNNFSCSYEVYIAS